MDLAGPLAAALPGLTPVSSSLAAMRDVSRPDRISRVEPPNVADQYAAVIYKQLWDFRSGARVGSPLLKGQSEVFKKAQLQAFAASQRTNDISHVRNIARAVTPQEIDRAAAYCGSQPPDIVKTIDQEIWIPHPRHKS